MIALPEHRHVPRVAGYVLRVASYDGTHSRWSEAYCSCGWSHAAAILPSSARRAWRRHLERAT